MRAVAIVAWMLCSFVCACASDVGRVTGASCTLNSDCASDLICFYERCRVGCRVDADCPEGAQCLPSTSGVFACQLPIETHCTYDTDCPAGLRCSQDSVAPSCTTACAEDRDCPGGRCVSTTSNGVTSRACEMITSNLECRTNADCALRSDGNTFCSTRGVCSVQCKEARDCRAPLVCHAPFISGAPQVQGAPNNRCGPPCINDADCHTLLGVEGECDSRAHVCRPVLRDDAGVRLDMFLGTDAQMDSSIDANVADAGAPDALELMDLSVTPVDLDVVRPDVSVPPIDMSIVSPDMRVDAVIADAALDGYRDAALLDVWAPPDVPFVWPYDAATEAAVVSCMPGYEMRDLRCEDINECARPLPCGSTGTFCVNTPGSFFCAALRSVDVGDQMTCAFFEYGYVKCWGTNGNGTPDTIGFRGQLGLEDELQRHAPPTRAIDFGAFVPYRLSVGDAHACVSSESTVKCWGGNPNGQLGYDDTNDRGHAAGTMGIGLPTVRLPRTDEPPMSVTTVYAGAQHSCVLYEDGRVYCWGKNDYGQLGVGDTFARGTDDTVHHAMSTIVAVPLPAPARALALGVTHTCALLESGEVLCWGGNAYGQLGQGHANALGDEVGEIETMSPVDLGAGVVVTDIAATDYASCAVFGDGGVKCWGSNANNLLGYGEAFAMSHIGDGPGEMGDMLPFIDFGLRDAVSISANAASVCVLLTDGSLSCWGGNDYGQLGYGDTIARTAPPITSVDVGGTIHQIAVGYRHTCARLSDARVKCWGLNTAGELGYGYASPGTAPLVMAPPISSIDLNGSGD